MIRAEDYLIRVKEEAYARRGIRPPIFDNYGATLEALAREVIAQRIHLYPEQAAGAQKAQQGVLELMREEASAVPPHEDPLLYPRLMTDLAAIEAAAKELGLPTVSRPAIGTYPTGSPNAVTIRVGPEYAIGIVPGIISFFTAISRIVSRTVRFEKKPDGSMSGSFDVHGITKILEQVPELDQRFREVLLGYIYRGDPGVSSTFFRQEPYRTFATMISTGMSRFVMGHEYGHIVASTGLRLVQMSADKSVDKQTQELIGSWEEELSCDAVGLQLTLISKRSDGVDFSITFKAVECFLTAMDILQRALSVARSGEEAQQSGSQTHPPWSLRREMARAAFSQWLKDDPRHQATLEIAGAHSSLLERLWQRSLTDVHKGFSSGQDVDPIWTAAG